MQSIDAINLTRFHHEDLESFMREIIDSLAYCSQLSELPQTQKLISAYQNFTNALQMDIEKASEALFLADIDADNMALTAEAQLKICAKSENDEKRHAALDLLEMFIPFTGMTDLPYAEEYENYYKLLMKLDQVPQNTRDMLHISEWIDRMHTHYNIMIDLMNKYQDSMHPFDPNAPKRARKAIETAWYDFELIVNAIGAVSPSQNVEDTIEKMNQTIQKYIAIVLNQSFGNLQWNHDDIDITM